MNKQEIEKAIYVMKNIKHLLVDVIGNKNNEKEFDVAIEMLKKQLANGWIPVEKELPKFTDDYLVSVTISTSFGDFDTVRTLPFYRRDGKGGWLLPENFDEVWKVRAWRELPEPYKNISEEVI